MTPGTLRILEPLERVILTLWVGGMWTVGFVVAPVLFTALESKTTAGQIAGRLFGYLSLAGLAFGVFLLAVLALQDGVGTVRSWRAWAVLGMLLITAVGQFVILPQMDNLKRLSGGGIPATGEIAARFGALHAVSTVLFIMNSLLGLIVVAGGITRSG